MTPVRWDRVAALVEASPGIEDLRAHGLHLLAARRWRAAGRPVPDDLVQEEISAAWRTHAAPAVLQRVRAACEGPMLLVKGPAVAARYPNPETRPFVDIDLVVPDARAAQRSLLAAGFRLADDPAHYPAHLHHLPPVHLPAVPVTIEVHSRLKWVDVLDVPPYEAVAEGAEPAALGVDGISTPAAPQHALVLAGHLWGHDPLTRLSRILDVAVMSEGTDDSEISSLAREWGVGRLWHATSAVAEALFGDAEARPWPLRTWARGLPHAREATVAELHLARVLAPVAAYPAVSVWPALRAALRGFVAPHDGESWRRKLRRTAAQLARPSMRRSEHVDELRRG